MLYTYMYILCIFATIRGGTSHRRGGSDIHCKDWCWNWSSSTLTTWCEEPTNWKRPWCWERLKAGGEGDDRRWDGLDGITDSKTMNLSKLKELVMDTEARHAVVHGVAKSLTWLSDWTELNHRIPYKEGIKFSQGPCSWRLVPSSRQGSWFTIPHSLRPFGNRCLNPHIMTTLSWLLLFMMLVMIMMRKIKIASDAVSGT